MNWSEEEYMAYLDKRKSALKGARNALPSKSRGAVKNPFTGQNSKYHNEKLVVDGRSFDSKTEALRFQLLKMMELGGEIHGLKCQVPFVIIEHSKVNEWSIRQRKYIADFAYYQNGQYIVEDVKSDFTVKDRVYRIKRDLFLSKYGNELTFRQVFYVKGEWECKTV